MNRLQINILLPIKYVKIIYFLCDTIFLCFSLLFEIIKLETQLVT